MTIQRALAAVVYRIAAFVSTYSLIAFVNNAFGVLITPRHVVLLHPQRDQQVHTSDAAAPALETTIRTRGKYFWHDLQAIKNAAVLMIAVPCWIVMENRCSRRAVSAQYRNILAL